ncbi:DNA repair protein RecO [Rickettsiales bacterium LUAb2]
MEINTEGIIVAKQKFGENSSIITLFTESHGILKGLIKGATSKKNQYLLQISNHVDINWRARLESHLGSIKLDLKHSIMPYVITEKLKLLTISTICELVSKLLVEGDINKDLYETTKNLIFTIKLDDFFNLYIKWELILLRSLGYGLDLSFCGVCKKIERVKYASPKTGVCVCEKIGEQYKNKLLLLPNFLIDSNNEITKEAKLASLKLTGYFINRFCNSYNRVLTSTRENMVMQFCS